MVRPDEPVSRHISIGMGPFRNAHDPPLTRSGRSGVLLLSGGTQNLLRSPWGGAEDTVADELILVIEDNALNLKLVRDVLLSRDLRVIASTTAERGLELARSEAPDLILMDIQLPGMDGVSALRLLKADPVTEHIPVIAVTASVMPMEREEILAAGFDGYQAKPISVKELTKEVRDHLDRSCAARASTQ
jgi:two-component system cell cycle response regulator DivK